MGQQQQTVTGSGSALRRSVLALAIAALMALLVMASTAPAFAAASDKANQVGKQTSGVNQSDPEPGRGGHVARDAAQDDGSSAGLGYIARYGRSNI
jgi:uncharacterized membrane protein